MIVKSVRFINNFFILSKLSFIENDSIFHDQNKLDIFVFFYII